MTMSAHLLHRGSSGEAGFSIFLFSKDQGCIAGYFSGYLEQPQQGVMRTISTVPPVLLFLYFIIPAYITPWFSDLQFGLGDSVLLPCKLMKFWTLIVCIFGLLSSVIYKHRCTQREEAARGLCPPHWLSLRHLALEFTSQEGAVLMNSAPYQ